MHSPATRRGAACTHGSPARGPPRDGVVYQCSDSWPSSLLSLSLSLPLPPGSLPSIFKCVHISSISTSPVPSSSQGPSLLKQESQRRRFSSSPGPTSHSASCFHSLALIPLPEAALATVTVFLSNCLLSSSGHRRHGHEKVPTSSVSFREPLAWGTWTGNQTMTTHCDGHPAGI